MRDLNSGNEYHMENAQKLRYCTPKVLLFSERFYNKVPQTSISHALRIVSRDLSPIFAPLVAI